MSKVTINWRPTPSTAVASLMVIPALSSVVMVPRPWLSVIVALAEALEDCKFERRLFGKLQEKIKAYFEGEPVGFGRDVPVVLDGYSEFGMKALEGCRKIKYGQTVSYGQLAKLAGRANAARAVGGILGKNRLPLIVPCHRVIRGDGGMGGFSAAGGVEMKEKMLELERKIGH